MTEAVKELVDNTEEQINNMTPDKKMMITTIIISIILFFILTYIHYSITYTKIKGEILIDDNKEAKEKLEIGTDRIENSENNEFTYSCWFYIETFDYKKTQTKTLFYKGDKNTKQYFPGVFIMPYTNNMKIILSESMKIVKDVSKSNNSEITIKNIPIRKWNHLLISMSGNTLSTYFNGYLEADL